MKSKNVPKEENEILCYGCEEPVGGDWNGEDWPPYCLDCKISSAENERDNYYDQDGWERKHGTGN